MFASRRAIMIVGVDPRVMQHREQIAAACRRHGVRTLELFGSAARGDHDPNDFDFFVDYIDSDWQGMSDRWFGLQRDLELALGSPVDLVSLREQTNPFFLQAVASDRRMIYAA